MSDQRCLYAMLHTPRERIEDVLMEHVAPIAQEIRNAPELDSLFFVRFSDPAWQIRFRVLGRPAWIESEISPRMHALAERLQGSGAIESFGFATYDREYERYGGEEGMALAEKLFFLDSLAAFDWIAAERRGSLTRPRREFSILLVDRLLDLARFTRQQRIAFYRHGYAWATEEWDADDVAALEQRFQKLKPGLDALFFNAPPSDPAALWGGADAARIAERFLSDAAPVVEAILEGHANGRIRQDLIYLFWSYAHMFTNRLGIESAGEAVLRFFLHRLIEERGQVPV